MDEESYKILTQMSVNVVLFNKYRRMKLRLIWKIRVIVINSILEEGYDIIHSDVDAVWLKNPIPEYVNKYSELDLIASEGFRFPIKAVNEWGFCLCFGFFLIRSNERTKRLFKAIVRSVSLTDNDQISMNEVLIRRNMTWQFETQYRDSRRWSSFLWSDQIIQGRGDDIWVGILPIKKFVRLRSYQEDPYVIHLHYNNMEDRVRKFKEDGLWFLE